MTYNRANNVLGWVVFGIALLTYLLTASPTASFWDCGEFIACANELEVPHPPGAPFFLVLGRLFVLLGSLVGVSHAAFMVNLLSVLASAFAVLFTFWTITLLARRALVGNYTDEPEPAQRTAILMAGLVGALTCAWAVSFWFNAVEAEVYALSSFFTAVVVWLIFKWDARADEPHSLRWLLLIAYLMGLSIGTHLLNLLTIPALGLVIYFRRYSFTWRGFFAAVGISTAALFVILEGINKYTFRIAWQFEKALTGVVDLTTGESSGLGLPAGTGTVLWLLLLLGGLVYGIWWSHTRGRSVLNISLLAVVLLYLGVSTYAIVPIRSLAKPPINEAAPDDLQAFLDYMERKQYGDRPLLRGPLYNALPMAYEKGSPLYYVFNSPQDAQSLGKDAEKLKLAGVDVEQVNSKYVLYEHTQEPQYPRGTEVFFPRMWDRGKYVLGDYEGGGLYHGSYINYVPEIRRGADPRSPYDDRPSGKDNLAFFFDYQVNYMYFRYFGWNFIGRSSDTQGSGVEDGLLTTAASRYAKVPANVQPYVEEAVRDAESDESRNHYYALPLLLGLLGAYWHFRRHRQHAFITLLLFLFTGLAIIVYLNQTPQQPRERDYSYAGSISTFAMWVGLGVLALYELLNTYLKSRERSNALLAGALAVAMAPALMGAQNWTDMSRAGNYTAPDTARALLESCAPNGILFTNGDNDTFPLWYLQEVEGVREDVRIINLSLLNTHWYIHELRERINQADAVPFDLPENFYMGERNGAWYKNDVPARLLDRNGDYYVSLPTHAQNWAKWGYASAAEADSAPTTIRFKVPFRGGGQQQYLFKQDVLILEMLKRIAADGWKRPVYFAITVPTSSFLGLQGYFRQEGMTFRLVPLPQKSAAGAQRDLNREVMYKNLMEKFTFRNLQEGSTVYLDANTQRMLGNYRNNYVTLAEAYTDEALQQAQPGQVADSLAGPGLRREELMERARRLLEKMKRDISPELSPLNSLTALGVARVYANLLKLGDAKAKAELQKWTEYARKRARIDLVNEWARVDPSKGEQPNFQQSYSARVLQSCLQLYRDNLKENAQAAAVARETYELTGEKYFDDLYRQLQKPAAPASAATVPDSGATDSPGTAPSGPDLP